MSVLRPFVTSCRRLATAVVLAAALIGAVLVATLLGGGQAGAATSRGSHVPTVIGTTVIGHSAHHRAIVAYHLGDPNSRVTAVLLGQMHGDEHAGVTVADAVIHGSPLAGVNLWVVPTMNPDGNVANIRQNADGVDLNRNWPDHWAHLTGEYYSGTRPLSEPETRAMYDFLRRIKPRLLVSIHQPLDGVDTTDGGALDPGFVRGLAAKLGLPLKPFVCWSVCQGSMTGWMTTQHRGLGFTIEFPAQVGAGYLRGQARAAILSSLGAVRDSPARHNPVTAALSVRSRSAGSVTVTGAAIDPDRSLAPVRITVTDQGRAVADANAHARGPVVRLDGRPRSGHGYAFTYKVAAGRHRVCVTAHNLRWGAGNVTACRTVTVAAPASPAPTPPSPTTMAPTPSAPTTTGSPTAVTGSVSANN